MINDKITVYGREIHNRIVIQPMEGCDGEKNGAPGELTKRRYLRFARSGAGIIWFEATATSGECRANPRQLYLCRETLPAYKQLVAEIKAEAKKACGFEPVIILQSTNSGRWSKPDGKPAPLVAYRNEYWEKGKENLPYTVVTDEYCDGVVKKYGEAAVLAAEAGFDGIDVKCCHGYLMNEMLSAYGREGKYGGCFENRVRLFFGCVDEVIKNAGGRLFVTTRLNAADFFPYPYGFGIADSGEEDLTETKKIIAALTDRGVELINLTLGNPYLIPHVNRPCKTAPENAQTGLERIKRVTKELSEAFPEVSFVMSGLSYGTDFPLAYADECLKEGVAALAGFGRTAFCYPQFYADYLKTGKEDSSKYCLGCAKCTELMRCGSVTGCAVRDARVYMPYYKKYVLGED